jgi:hypothetical protein
MPSTPVPFRGHGLEAMHTGVPGTDGEGKLAYGCRQHANMLIPPEIADGRPCLQS